MYETDICLECGNELCEEEYLFSMDGEGVNILRVAVGYECQVCGNYEEW